MSQKLITHSTDLKKLRDDGFEIEIKNAYLLIHSVPYVNSEKEIARGTLVSNLTLAGDVTTRPDSHVMYFIGDHPCNNDGSVITGIRHQSQTQTLAEGIVVNHSFSNKPPEGYKDYYEKVVNYVKIISAPAESINPSVTAKTFKVVESENPNDVFNYLDTNSSRAEISTISSKFDNLKIAIVGLGGTGSYILDLIAKTQVKEIHLFDGDDFLQHNAFRAPGAASVEELNQKPKKVAYLEKIYSKMHKNIISHDYYLTLSNVEELMGMDYVFICIDSGETKKILIGKLIENGVTFIDVGIGVQIIDNSLLGNLRVTSCVKEKNDYVDKRVSFANEGNNDYSQNIQIAELNALNAALAVIKWKKMCHFYHDQENEYNTIYGISVNKLFNDEIVS